MKRYYIFFSLLSLFCIAAVASNTFIRRGPAHDTKVVDDLDNISQAISSYASTMQKLPSNLNLITVQKDTRQRLSDYHYQVTGKLTYSLCATFLTKGTGTAGYLAAGSPDTSNHAKGYTCFQYKLDDYIINSYAPMSTKSSPTPTPESIPTPTPGTSQSATKLCSTPVPSGANYLTPRTIEALDLASHALTLSSTSLGGKTTFYLYWQATSPTVYDQSCKTIAITDLKVGDQIQAYYTSGNYATVIQKQ